MKKMNVGFPVRYVDPVFRPPSEAESLILPVTDGCSWNQCAFCEMYAAPQKKFRARDEAEILETLRRCGERFGSDIRRVFLAEVSWRERVLATGKGKSKKDAEARAAAEALRGRLWEEPQAATTR